MSIDIDIRHLRVVVTVIDCGSYTLAAETLHVAQSSVSRTVQDVERRLGIQVFDRTTRHLEMTPDGAQFVKIARQLLGQFDAALRHFSGYLDGTRGTASIATLASLAATMLPPVLSHYRTTHPNVDISIQDAFSLEVLDRVRSGLVDFALAATPNPPDTLQSERIAADRFYGVFAGNHRFAEANSLSWHDFDGEPFIAFDPASSIRSYVDSAFRSAHVSPGSVLEARDIGAVAGLTAAGLGVSIVPALVLPMVGFAGLQHRLITNPIVERNIALLYAPERPMAPAARGLMNTLRQASHHGLELPDGARWIDEHRQS